MGVGHYIDHVQLDTLKYFDFFQIQNHLAEGVDCTAGDICMNGGVCPASGMTPCDCSATDFMGDFCEQPRGMQTCVTKH